MAVFTKIMLSEQNFVHNSYTYFRENPVNGSVADTGRQTGRGIDEVLYMASTEDVFIYFIMKSGFGGLVVSMLASGTRVRGF